MSLAKRLDAWGRKRLNTIIGVGIIASLVCAYILPVVTNWEVGCSIGAFLFFACVFNIYVRATVR